MWPDDQLVRSTGASSLFPVGGRGRLPAFDPGDVSTKGATEVDRGLVDGQSMHGRPQLQLVSVALAFVAVVASGL